MHSIFRSVLVAAALVSAASTVAAEQADPLAIPPPTPARALLLVLETQAVQIAAIDAARDVNLHDMKRHEWSVQRPFYPGIFDSTHQYRVIYSIDGEAVAEWSVDLRDHSVVEQCRDRTWCGIK